MNQSRRWLSHRLHQIATAVTLLPIEPGEPKRSARSMDLRLLSRSEQVLKLTIVRRAAVFGWIVVNWTN